MKDFIEARKLDNYIKLNDSDYYVVSKGRRIKQGRSRGRGLGREYKLKKICKKIFLYYFNIYLNILIFA